MMATMSYYEYTIVDYQKYYFSIFFSQLDPNRTLFDQSSELPYDMVWEFPRERVNFMKDLGSGAFGLVKLATAEGIDCKYSI